MVNVPRVAGLETFRDGFSDLIGGMDSSRAPDLIDEQHAALAVNISFRGGKPQTRPKFIQQSLGDPANADVLKVKNGYFQGGGAYYSTALGRSVLVGVYSGWVMKIDPVAGTTNCLNPNSRNDQRRKHYMVQGEHFLVIQNGVDIPLIWDGVATEARRSYTGANNGVLGTYNSAISEPGTTLAVSSAAAHGLATGMYGYVGGSTLVAGQFGVDQVTTYTFRLNTAGSYQTITTIDPHSMRPGYYGVTTGGTISITNTGTHTFGMYIPGVTSTVTTQTAHGLADGDYIQLDGTDGGMTFNGQFYVSGVTANTYRVRVGSSRPAPSIFGTTRRCPEIPIGLMMAYGQGRIFLAAANRTEFEAGDIIYGDVNSTPENILRWTEQQYTNEGGAYRLPAEQGRIMAMTFPSTQDTGTGQGELFVFGEYGVASFQVSAQRASVADETGQIVSPGWKDIAFQKITLQGAGCSSQWSLINFTNGDLFYRDPVGIRSYRNARADQQGYGQTPISSELSRILSNDPQTRLGNISGTHFYDRAFMTCSPKFEFRRVRVTSIAADGKVTTADEHGMSNGTSVTLEGTSGLNGTYVISSVAAKSFYITLPSEPNLEITGSSAVYGSGSGTEIYHKGVVVLDFNSTSGVGGKATPAWDGVWCGVDFQQIASGYFDGTPACYAFVYGGPGDNQVWELTTDYEGGDEPLDGDPTPIQWQLETRSYDFQKPYNRKRLLRLDTWLSDLRGEAEMEIFYRLDGRSCWTPWTPTWKRCATISDPLLLETNPNVEGILQNRPQVRTQITQPKPPNVCEAVQGGFTNCGFEVQIRYVGTGRVTLDKGVIWAEDLVEKALATCPAGPTTVEGA